MFIGGGFVFSMLLWILVVWLWTMYVCIFLRFCFIVVDDVCSGSVSMFMVKLLLW